MECEIQLKESEISRTIGILNPGSTGKESRIQRVESRIQIPLARNPESRKWNPESQFSLHGGYQFLSLYINGRCWQDSLPLGNPVSINANPITLINLAFLKLIVCVNYRVFSFYNMVAEEVKHHYWKTLRSGVEFANR